MASQQAKTSWPELVGTNGESAAETIRMENPNAKDVVVLVEGRDIAGRDLKTDRVRVWVNQRGIVTRTPTLPIAVEMDLPPIRD